MCTKLFSWRAKRKTPIFQIFKTRQTLNAKIRPKMDAKRKTPNAMAHSPCDNLEC